LKAIQTYFNEVIKEQGKECFQGKLSYLFFFFFLK